MQAEEHDHDFQKFVQVLGNSKEKFQEIFSGGGKGSSFVDTESCVESTMEELT